MRLDHLLSKEKEEVRVVMLLSFQGKAKYLLVVMRLWETPVPIPNTTVKTYAADGTALETVWESRWLPAPSLIRNGQYAYSGKHEDKMGL